VDGGKEKDMNRKIIYLALCAMLFALCFSAEAQQPKKVPRIGYLGLIEIPERDEAFRKGLRERGYVEGQNIHVEYRFAEGRVERLAELAPELIRLKVDLIVTTGAVVTDAAKRATRMIPIVFTVVVDPVGSGFVASLARPDGNITGFSTLNAETAGKRLELLREVKPRISRVAVLQNPANPTSPLMFKETEAAEKRLGIRLQSLNIRSPDDLVGAFQAATREQAGALVGLPDNLLASQQRRIRDFAIKNRLPEISWSSEWVEAGSLMSYGANIPDLYRRAASYVDKILKGAKPADLPVEQPMKFEFVINLKTAKQIGLTIPPNVLARADKVIK
jgi:putative tryptophan/tyrosine transport system substrate-binding protein